MTVISSELINTAIETTVDIAMPNKNELAKREIPSSVVESWEKGGEGALDIANKIVELADQEEDKFEYIYDLDEPFAQIKKETGVTVHGILGSRFFKQNESILDFCEFKAYFKK